MYMLLRTVLVFTPYLNISLSLILYIYRESKMRYLGSAKCQNESLVKSHCYLGHDWFVNFNAARSVILSLSNILFKLTYLNFKFA